jgi:hypothetical protein
MVQIWKKSNWQTEKKFRSTEKKFRCAGPEIFLRFETDLNFSRPWFSEMKVQIKWPNMYFICIFSQFILFYYVIFAEVLEYQRSYFMNVPTYNSKKAHFQQSAPMSTTTWKMHLLLQSRLSWKEKKTISRFRYNKTLFL